MLTMNRVAVATVITNDGDTEAGSCVINYYEDKEEQETEIRTSIEAAEEEALDRFSTNVGVVPPEYRVVVQVLSVPEIKVRSSVYHTTVPAVLPEPEVGITPIPA